MSAQPLPVVFMFSGQGSQYYQMGASLFERNEIFRSAMQRLDGVVRRATGFSTGVSIIDTLYSPTNTKSMTFDRLRLSNPAIFMIQYSLAQALQSGGLEPQLTLGASLGSIVAATVSGMLHVDDALASVVRNAEIIEKYCRPGGMVAVLASPALLDEAFLRDHSEVVAINFDSHFVVAAPGDRCTVIERELNRRGLVYQRLPVHFAFHSRWIEDASAALRDSAQGLQRRSAATSMMCCQSTRIINDLPQNYFWDVARNPIRFSEAVAVLERSGPHRYIDLGPAGTLATFLKYVLPKESKSRFHSILTPYGRDVENLDGVLRDS